MSAERLIKGSAVWYQDPSIKSGWPWIHGHLISDPAANGFHILLDNGQIVEAARCEPANPLMQEGANDLMQLSNLNEPSLLYNMETRFKHNTIYTLAGTVLIAVNPFQRLDVYSDDAKKKYKGAAASATVSQSASFGSLSDPTTLPPHIYSIAGDAFRQMERENRSQNIVISGESGSGKTESTKHALQYLANLSHDMKREGQGQAYEQKILETNPILEAFGNAKTVRNDNSSRFGKLIQIHFNHQQHIVGASIRTYLLEKSRVAHQAPNERSYHIFYQLLAGASPEQRSRWHLPPQPSDFTYLAKSQLVVDGVDDGSDFSQVCAAFSTVGFTQQEVAATLDLVAAVLWLGNIEFQEGNNDDSSLLPGAAAGHAAALLGVDSATLAYALTHRSVPGLGTARNLKKGQALEARDALAKAVYAGLFDWIVDKINGCLFPGARATGTYIGVLDIFGFEAFQHNSFEQLCINYANEKLQQQFCRHEFNLRLQEYKEEFGDNFPRVEYQDNQRCVDLLEGTSSAAGVFALLDQEAKMPGQRTGMDLVASLVSGTKQHQLLSTLKQDRAAFRVAHFSDTVTYQANEMNAKNKDDISHDLSNLLAGSRHALLASLGSKMKEAAGGRKGPRTVGARFRQEMRELEQTLDATDLHFVRCIKPTDRPTPPNVEFNQAKVMDQLRSAGILTVAQLAKSGYPTRYEVSRFVAMYSSLGLRSSSTIRLMATGVTGWLDAQEPTLQDCEDLLARLGIRPGEYAIGRTKIFFRTGVLGRVEDQYAALKRRLHLLSCALRRFQWNRWLRLLRRRVTLLQGALRCRLAVAELGRLKKERQEAEKELQAVLLLATRKTLLSKLAREAQVQAIARMERLEKAAAAAAAAAAKEKEMAEQHEKERMWQEAEKQKRLKEEEQRRKEREDEQRKKEREEEQRRKEREEEQRRKEREEEQRRKEREEEQRKKEREEQQRKEREEVQRKKQEEEQRKRDAEAEQERRNKEKEALDRQAMLEAQKQQELQELERQRALQAAAQAAAATPPPPKSLAAMSPQYAQYTRSALEGLSRERLQRYEVVAEVLNHFLDVSERLGDELARLQDVVTGKTPAPVYYNVAQQHALLQKKVDAFASRFQQQNLTRAANQVMLLSRDGRAGAGEKLLVQCEQMQKTFQAWLQDIKARLKEVAPFVAR